MNIAECQRLCVDFKNIDNYQLLEIIKKYPTGISGQKLAEELCLPFEEVKMILLQLCLISQFVLV